MCKRQSDDNLYVWPHAEIENDTKRAYEPLPLEEEVEGDWFGMALAAFFIAFGICAILYTLVQWGVL